MKDEKIEITEGIEGYYHYHFSEKGKHSIALCGAKTMSTSMSLNQWGFVGHLKERYCELMPN